jgi:hypothetical protein
VRQITILKGEPAAAALDDDILAEAKCQLAATGFAERRRPVKRFGTAFGIVPRPQLYLSVIPPSTTSSMPVTYFDSSEARYRQA